MASLSKASNFSVALTAEMNDLVQQAIESGEYASGSDVICEALQEWKLRRTLKLDEKTALQSLWGEGLAGGPGRFSGIEDIKSEARRRFEAERNLL